MPLHPHAKMFKIPQVRNDPPKPSSNVEADLSRKVDEIVNTRSEGRLGLLDLSFPVTVEERIRRLRPLLLSGSTPSSVRIKILGVLSGFRHKDAVMPVLEALSKPDADPREECAANAALAVLGQKIDLVSEFSNALCHHSPSIRKAAVVQLGELYLSRDERILRALIARMEKETEVEVRRKIYDVVCQARHAFAIPAIIRVSNEQDDYAQAVALKSLVAMTHANARREVLRKLKTGKTEVRRLAAALLKDKRDVLSIRVLMQSTASDPDASVRLAALDSLENKNHPGMKRFLLKAAKDGVLKDKAELLLRLGFGLKSVHEDALTKKKNRMLSESLKRKH